MKVRIPLTERTVQGQACPRPEVTLRVRSSYGDYFPVRFVIDTGADVTSILIPRANVEGIPFRRTRPSTATGMVGAAAQYCDTIRVIVAGREYEWPCNFVAPSAAVAATFRESLPVLNRAGFLDAYNFCLADGYLVLTRRGSLSHHWDRFRSLLGAPLVRQCPAADPI